MRQDDIAHGTLGDNVLTDLGLVIKCHVYNCHADDWQHLLLEDIPHALEYTTLLDVCIRFVFPGSFH